MARKSVPVTMGSPKFTVQEIRRFMVTHAWFPPRAFLEPHVHDRPTFAVILDGGFDLQFTSPAIRRKSLPSPAGSIFTEPAGETHANTVSGRGASVIVVQPRPDEADLSVDGLQLLDRINHFRHGRIYAIGRELASEVLMPDSVSPLAVESLALEILVEAARLDEAHRRPGEYPPWMGVAIDYVHDHFRDSIRIADVARAAGVHPAHLAALFRRLHKMPLARYVRKLRVRWAAEALDRTEYGISHIAHRAGFADQAHLTRAFKRETGVTPGRFRRHRWASVRRRRGTEPDQVTADVHGTLCR